MPYTLEVHVHVYTNVAPAWVLRAHLVVACAVGGLPTGCPVRERGEGGEGEVERETVS